jgi:hypothetical protein
VHPVASPITNVNAAPLVPVLLNPLPINVTRYVVAAARLRTRLVLVKLVVALVYALASHAEPDPIELVVASVLGVTDASDGIDVPVPDNVSGVTNPRGFASRCVHIAVSAKAIFAKTHNDNAKIRLIR